MRLVANIAEEFRKNLGWAARIDIASAWATPTESLNALAEAVKRRGISVRSIIGISDRATHPDALSSLQEAGALRIAGDPPLFHPKIYIFYGQAKAVAWIGSANFTSAGGFGHQYQQGVRCNTETLFETRAFEAAAEWFEKIWNSYQEVCSEQLEEYREKYKKKPPAPPLNRIVQAPSAIDPPHPHIFLKEAQDWGGYVRALKKCDEWWRRHRDGQLSVLSKTDSWFHTITNLRPVAESEDWSQLGADECDKLLGRIGGEGRWALLGNMRGAAKACSSFKKNRDIRREIGEIVGLVINATDHEFPQCAVEAVKAIIRKFPGYGIAVATRLLAIARPDRCVSLNGQSKGLLASSFSQCRKLSAPDGYGRLLEQVYRQPWYRAGEPEDQSEREWWDMRAALLDCFVYERSKT